MDLRRMLALLERLVKLESPSTDKRAVDRFSAVVAAEIRRLGARVTWHRSRDYGNHLQADFGSGAGLLVLGHLDTVWGLGTLRRMPFRVAKGRAWGPGVLDMKGGIVALIFALRMLRRPPPLTVLLTSDEEIGSPSSRPIIERLARRARVALVLEPPTGLHGALKTSRKGTGEYLVRVRGRAAHAGVDFTSGVSATLELARLIARIAAFTDLRRGITVNAGVIGGGTRTNVVAEEAWARVDIRIARMRDANGLDRKFRALRPAHPEAKLEISGGLNRPPMERTPAIAALFRKARALAAPLGIDLEESSTGGGSDGNFTAALGVPTLDGLGAVGEGAHAAHESILLDQFPRRAALLAHLLLSFK